MLKRGIVPHLKTISPNIVFLQSGTWEAEPSRLTEPNLRLRSIRGGGGGGWGVRGIMATDYDLLH